MGQLPRGSGAQLYPLRLGSFDCVWYEFLLKLPALPLTSFASLGTIASYGLKKKPNAVRNCRNIGKKDMKLNHITPTITVDPESYRVRPFSTSLYAFVDVFRRRSKPTACTASLGPPRSCLSARRTCCSEESRFPL